ncbi:MAG TPA: response regulator transcription factor [Anaerolineales bacterium]|nr:response regulator transcription factor [Anaerolineales bacterium]
MARIALLVPGTVLRRGLEAVFNEDPAIEIVYSNGSIPESGYPGGVDVLVTGGPEIDPRLVFEGVSGSSRPPAVLLLGDDTGALRPWLALPFRAIGALPAGAAEGALVAAIAALSEGLAVWHPDLIDGRVAWMTDPDAEDPDRPFEPVDPLTEREIEVLQLLARGYANKRVALELSISEHTVKFHVSSIYGKLSAGNRTEAVRIGLQTGLITI